MDVKFVQAMSDDGVVHIKSEAGVMSLIAVNRKHPMLTEYRPHGNVEVPLETDSTEQGACSA